MLDQVGELRVPEQGRDHRVDVVDRPLGEVTLAIRPQLVEQVHHVTCTDLHQQQIAELGQHVVLEPAPRSSSRGHAPDAGDPVGDERAGDVARISFRPP